jgi:hypothetical protein
MDFIVERRKKVFVGIDNGKEGGISVIDENENIIECIVMPVLESGTKKEYDVNQIVNYFKAIKFTYNTTVGLEDCHIMPKNGGKQNFKTGEQFGIIKGILKGLSIPYEIVKARDWQKEILKSLTVKDTKLKSIMYCQNKYPGVDFRRTERSKKQHDGKTDSLCIAIYTKRKY